MHVLLTPVFLLTDIMVDTPDEQSIVTYVAQFLEHFPELEAVCLVFLTYNSETTFPSADRGMKLVFELCGSCNNWISISCALPHFHFKSIANVCTIKKQNGKSGTPLTNLSPSQTFKIRRDAHLLYESATWFSRCQMGHFSSLPDFIRVWKNFKDNDQAHIFNF